jgi:hypothetical protein
MLQSLVHEGYTIEGTMGRVPEKIDTAWQVLPYPQMLR